jgi:uncharacterized protein YcbX
MIFLLILRALFYIYEGVRVESWPLTEGGLYLDREFAVVSNRTGKVLTQKTYPKLALCKINIDIASGLLTISIAANDNLDSNSISIGILEQPCNEIVTVASPSIFDDSVIVCSRSLPIFHFNDMDSAHKQEYNLASAWFTSYLREPCTFVRRKHSVPLVSSESVSHGNFSNEAQFLLITESSLRVLSHVSVLF